MIEKRALVKDLKETRATIEKLGVKFKSNYIFRDIIFLSREKGVLDDIVRVRVYIKSNWPTKKVVLIKKKNEWANQTKRSNIFLKKEFDKEKEAFDFIKERLPEFIRGPEYEREGWQYDFDDCQIFLEDIKGFKPSIEIESEDERKMDYLFKKLRIVNFLKESIPEIMYNISKN